MWRGIAIILMFALAGCAQGFQIFNHEIHTMDLQIQKAADQVWTEKDCRAGFYKGLIETHSVALETSIAVDRLVQAADQNSADFKKCYYFATMLNADWFLAKQAETALQPGIVDLAARLAK